jgi:hypothetical protein
MKSGHCAIEGCQYNALTRYRDELQAEAARLDQARLENLGAYDAARDDLRQAKAREARLLELIARSHAALATVPERWRPEGLLRDLDGVLK